MPHGGYHGTQVIGGKITQLGDEFKDSAGNIKPQFSVTGDKDTGFNVSMAKETFNPRAREAMYASPDDILQNIIDRKDVLKLQASPDRPGMNVYQDTIQDFRTSSPVNAAAYEQRFPLTAGLENIISSGGIFGTLARAAFDQGKETASNLAGSFDINLPRSGSISPIFILSILSSSALLFSEPGFKDIEPFPKRAAAPPKAIKTKKPAAAPDTIAPPAKPAAFKTPATAVPSLPDVKPVITAF
jgi:hypothetical protein